jgi:hypothetical protein
MRRKNQGSFPPHKKMCPGKQSDFHSYWSSIFKSVLLCFFFSFFEGCAILVATPFGFLTAENGEECCVQACVLPLAHHGVAAG